VPARAAPARPARFAPGQVVYALDGPLTVVSATADYIATRQFTKYAVGAGSTTLVRTQAGLVIVDAGMQQQGGRYNAQLADAIVDALVGTSPARRCCVRRDDQYGPTKASRRREGRYCRASSSSP
jgi:hypothetical protein